MRAGFLNERRKRSYHAPHRVGTYPSGATRRCHIRAGRCVMYFVVLEQGRGRVEAARPNGKESS
jgi:hypothetical protein